MPESPAVPRRERLRVFLRGNGRQILFWLVLFGFVALGLQRHWKGSVLMTGVLIGFLLGKLS